MTILSRAAAAFAVLAISASGVAAQSCSDPEVGGAPCAPVQGCLDNGVSFSGRAVGLGEGRYVVALSSGEICAGQFKIEAIRGGWATVACAETAEAAENTAEKGRISMLELLPDGDGLWIARTPMTGDPIMAHVGVGPGVAPECAGAPIS